MGFNPDWHHRRSIRLRKYDYSRVGGYFLTLCAQGRECLFGEVIGERTELSEAGRVVDQAWKDLPRHYPHVTLDQFVVMPNHVHGILLLTALDTEPSPGCRRPPVSEVVRAFKSYSGRRINRQRGTVGLPVWQRNYYERVLRDEGELMAARIYILENPLRWGSDPQR